MSWSWIDIAILVVIAVSMITGLVRGFFKELIALGIWLLAFWLAYNYTAAVETLLKPYIHDPSILKISSFVLIIVCTLLAGGLFNAILSFLLKRSGLSGTDRLLGMLFGITRGVLVVALIIVVLEMTSIPLGKDTEGSILYPKFTPLVSWLNLRLPNVMSQIQWLEEQEDGRKMQL